MDFYNKSLKDFKNLRSNASARAGTSPQPSGSMTGGDWAGIGLQVLGAINAQKMQDDEIKRQQREADQAKMNDNKLYRDQRGDIEDKKIFQQQDRRFRGLNFLNDQVESNRQTARKRSFRDAMYDSMR